MEKQSFLHKLKDVSITKKLYFTVGIMAVLIVFELFTLWFSIQTLSSVRAFVGAEGLWSKAQKDAVYQLSKYCRTHNEEDFKAFQGFMSVPLGDHMTRLELLKPKPDLSIARAGFLQGRIHPDDIDGMINLVRRFHNISYINRAIRIWAQGDSIIEYLSPIGDALHAEIQSANPSDEKLIHLLEKIGPINERLTKLEDEFSYTLGEGSRWLENLVLKLLFIVALTVEITGLLITISVSRDITRGLGEINRATRKIAEGDLEARANVLSKDEIGQVATAVNHMTEQLVLSNKELGHFAYIASHDLQEPLRSITNYSKLLDEKYKDQVDEDGKKYLSSIIRSTGRMQLLVKDMLDYSRIGHDKSIASLNCEQLIEEVLNDLKASIKESNAEIKRKKLPTLNGHHEIKLVFQNLISNAIKFRKKDHPLLINIDVKDQENNWLFRVSDNGIGIEKEYFERIFIIFQRLHSKNEYPGSGIGLAHCKKIVELHGGEIGLVSEYGSGSEFYFTIPKDLKK
jgi:two-component system, sensor histidine kinase